MSAYEQIFEQRGTSYHQAMQAFPNARAQEFEQIIQSADLKEGAMIADVPAGGGYLKPFLPKNVRWHGHEPCDTFINHGVKNEVHHETSFTGSENVSLLPLPWDDNSMDAVFSLAGVHHLEDRKPFFTDIARITKPSGTFVLSDVEAGSNVARFLDDFVGTHNSTGHEGRYLDQSTLEALRNTGWLVKSNEIVNFHWAFKNKVELVEFCQVLFDLKKASKPLILNYIENELGIDALPSGLIGMRWSLMTIVSHKLESQPVKQVVEAIV